MVDAKKYKTFEPYLEFYWKAGALFLVGLIFWVIMNVSFDISQKAAK